MDSLSAAAKFAEGLFWAARMSTFTGWGKWYVEMIGGPIGHTREVLEFAKTHRIGGRG